MLILSPASGPLNFSWSLVIYIYTIELYELNSKIALEISIGLIETITSSGFSIKNSIILYIYVFNVERGFKFWTNVLRFSYKDFFRSLIY